MLGVFENSVQGGPKIGTILYALTSSNINRFSKLFHCRNQEKLVIILSLKIPPHLKCVATLPCEMSLRRANCRSVSLIAPLVAGLSASSSSKADTLNI